jgi:hypothetical protein
VNLTQIDRNRIVAASLLTALLLPLAWLAAGAGDGTAATPTTAVVTTTTFPLGIGANANADTPANLEGPTGAGAQGEGQIAFPADLEGQYHRGTASYKRFPESARTGCITAIVPLGVEIVVRNLDNGRTVTCLNINIGYVPPVADIILNTRLFEDLGRLVDAPLPVEFTW